MPRATCRCGQRLSFPADGPDRVICPSCGSKIRVRRRDPSEHAASLAGVPEGDGYLRFPCPCGRRLKVRDTHPRPQAGRCPDCNRVVPVPATAVATVPAPAGGGGGKGGGRNIESPTEVLTVDELAALERWAEGHRGRGRPQPASVPFAPPLEAVPPTESAMLPQTPLAAPAATAVPIPARAEAGLRVCPRCGRPVHMGAETCRQCGFPVPRR